jgi:tripartite-type tricarboxylate transporter receptor subunit TctC
MKRNGKLVFMCLFVLLVSAGLFAAGGKESVSAYPSENIQVISPTRAGGATDASARIIAQYIQETLKNPVVVVNQDGGGGSVGSETVRTAKPDGYKLLYNHTMLPCNYHSGKYAYSYRDFTPIATMAHVSQTIAVRSDAPWNTLADLVKDAKNNPGKYIFGVQFGSVSNFVAGTLISVAGVDFKLVDSGGEAEKLAALQGGHLDIIQATVGASRQYVAAGKMKVLAVASGERDSLAPEFLTAREQGYDVSLPTMHTLYGPKGLPEEVIKVLHGVFARMGQDKDFLEKLNKAGQNYVYRNFEETQEFVKNEDAIIEAVAKKLGMKK